MQTEQLPRLEAGEYPGGIWYYEPHTYLPYRDVLGRVGRHPLVCIGINPSTAQPGALDPTLKSVERLAAANGFDSWIMLTSIPSGPPTPTVWTKRRTAPSAMRTSAGFGLSWPRRSPPCGPPGAP